MRTLLLLSGGLDSSVILADLIDQGREVETLTFNYNQTHVVEVDRAKAIAEYYGVPHLVIPIKIPMINKVFSDVSIAFVPARNLIFLSIALNRAINLGFDCISMGVNQTDEQGFPDCSSAFISSFQKTADQTSPCSIKIETPLIKMEKHEIVRKGYDLGLDFSTTHTCYSPQNGLPCGLCESCIIRLKAFDVNNLKDSANYV